MNIKNIFYLVTASFLLGSSSFGMGTKPTPISLLVVPANFTVMQIAFDVANQYSVVLMSYQKEAGAEDPVLHAWDGSKWVYISVADYASASFVKITPQRTLVIGPEGPMTSVLVSAAESWCPEVMNLPSIKTDELVNALGRLFNFNKSQWNWYAARYQFQLKDLNETRRSRSWYDGPYVDERGRRAGESLILNEPVSEVMGESVMEDTYIEETPAPITSSEPELIYEVSTTPPPGPADLDRGSPPDRSEFVIETEEVPAYEPPAPARESTPPQPAIPSFRGWEEEATATEVPLK